MAQVVAAAGTAAAVAAVGRPLGGGGSGADALRPAARLSFAPRWCGGSAGAARARRESAVTSVISRAPRLDAEVLPVSADDDADVKVLSISLSSYSFDWYLAGR